MLRRKFLNDALCMAVGFGLGIYPCFTSYGKTAALMRIPMIKLNNNNAIPVVGLGTYSLKGKICVDSIFHALRAGYRLIDTAHAYGNEREVGEAVRKAISAGIVTREEVTVITKLYPNQYSSPEEAIEESLKKLDIGWCDIMLLHHPGNNDIAAYKTMEKYVSSGAIHALGLSCFYIKELTSFLSKINIKPVLVQNEIHPYYQDRQVTSYIQGEDIAVMAWYPLGGRGHQKELFADPVLNAIAQKHGKSVAQVMLKWNVQHGVIVIPGSSNPKHQVENISIFNFELTEDEMNAIDSLNRDEKHDWY